MKCSLSLCVGCDSVTGGSQPFCTFFCAFCFTEIRVVSQQNRTLTLACCFFLFFCCCCFCVFVVVLVFLVVAQNSKLLNSRTGFRNLPTSVWCLLFGLFVVFVSLQKGTLALACWCLATKQQLISLLCLR